MKKLLFLLSFLFILCFSPIVAHANLVPCPNVDELEKTTIKDKKELIQALKTLIPSTYEKGEEGDLFSEWNIITATPFTKTKKRDRVYREMAKNFCGKEIANRSWLVRIAFPKWEGKSASMSEGQLFVVKRKGDEWFVWFRYH